jgi:hypothetical protein
MAVTLKRCCEKYVRDFDELGGYAGGSKPPELIPQKLVTPEDAKIEEL